MIKLLRYLSLGTGDIQTLNTKSTGGVGSGTVTSVSVTTANGVSGTVATATTTPAISLTLGAITPTTPAGPGLTTFGPSSAFPQQQQHLQQQPIVAAAPRSKAAAAASGAFVDPAIIGFTSNTAPTAGAARSKPRPNGPV